MEDDAVTINKCIPQRALFKAMQHTSSIPGSAIQRGLAKEAHAHGHVENNEFASVAFDLPDLSDETDKPITFHLYAIVEAANTACISTLSPDEKKADKNHRNIWCACEHLCII